MQYRKDKYGNDISVLGYGCMRFTKKAGGVDLEKAEKEILAAYKAGVNYFDTAYIYPGSEAALGRILEKNSLRDKVYIATKLPHYMLKSAADAERYFNEELRRLRTDHVDFYLMHMLTDLPTWQRLCEMGIPQWLEEKKRTGAIRQVGFSYHGNSDMFCRLVDVYDWDICLIQYNYLDEHSQAGRTGLMHAYKKGLPVFIMEPLRGGKLANGLPVKAKKLFGDHPEKRTPAGWALRWLWDQPQITCVLSGMNSLETVYENAENAAASLPGCLTDRDKQLFELVKAAVNEKMKVGCTGCGYCMPCPVGVDIPGSFSAYNRRYAEGKFSALFEYSMCTLLRKDATSASKCIGCGKCEQHCPQNLPIRAALRDVKKELEGPLYKTAAAVLPLVMKY